jgi:ubiquinone/menaquinone biosynthesis C-methylase UbiE
VGYVFSLQDAERYDDWFRNGPGRLALTIEKEAIRRLWQPRSGQCVLDVGCGTGLFAEWFAELGLQVTGLEPSPHMLQLARVRLPNRVSLERGFAEDLPFQDNSFDAVTIITTLEFAENPLQAIQEACRVARDKVILGVLNKYSLVSWQRRLEMLWKSSVYRHARFYGVFQLQRLVKRALCGPVPIKWATCLTFPLAATRFIGFLESSRYFQWHPLGHFIVMSVDMRYIVRTLQQPLFDHVSHRVGASHPHPTCFRLPRPERHENRTCANL